MLNEEELSELLANERADLNDLQHLSDDALKMVVCERMSAADEAQLTQLMMRNSQGQLTSPEQETLMALVERGLSLMLRKAEAAALLVQHGYSKSALKALIARTATGL